MTMILHIEDDPAIAELARYALNKASHYSLMWLSDGQLALDYLLRQGAYAGKSIPLPKMILLDLQIPSVSGMEVLRQVKQATQTASIPVVVLTSSESTADIALSRRYKADAYLIKPTDAQEYVEMVREAVRQWAD